MTSLISLFLLTLVCYIIHNEAKDDITFGIGLTTIPPRFDSIHHVINSWLQQDTSPTLIVIFIPKKYNIFTNGIGKNKDKNILYLQKVLQDHFNQEMLHRRIKLQVVSQDFGPLTKYIGMLEYFSSFGDNDGLDMIDYWVIGDDDVHYDSKTLTGYWNAIADHKPPSSVSEYIMTHFKVHSRLQVLLDNELYPIAHLQGVDTVMFPGILLQQHSSAVNGTLNYDRVVKVAAFYHQECPESFFQDDYIISAIIFASQIPIRSIWEGTKVALHVDEVSTSFQQMHLSVDVFEREQITKQCVEENMYKILRILHHDPAMHALQYDLWTEKLEHMNSLSDFDESDDIGYDEEFEVEVEM